MDMQVAQITMTLQRIANILESYLNLEHRKYHIAIGQNCGQKDCFLKEKIEYGE